MTFSQTWRFYRWVIRRWHDYAKEILDAYRRWDVK